MNTNKIVELAAQACRSSDPAFSDPAFSDPAFVCAVGIPPQYIEKFAELIVKECGKVAYEHFQQRGGDESSAEVAIRTHFGIK
jgi:hypothetical protein